jgi:hypothetical protein
MCAKKTILKDELFFDDEPKSESQPMETMQDIVQSVGP